MKYLYSLGAVSNALAKIALNASTDGDVNTGAWHEGRSAFMPIPPIKFIFNADPHDVAIAEIILNRVPMQHVVFHKHSDAIDLPEHERIKLEEMIGMHLSLDCLNLLVDALANDTIPGAVLDDCVCLTLPEIA